MRMPTLLTSILLIAALTGCAISEGENVVTAPAIDATVGAHLTLTATPVPAQETHPSPGVGAPTPGQPPTPKAQPQICAPLTEHTIPQLPNIVSDPYAPPPPGKDERHHGIDFAYYNHAGRPSILGEGVQSIFAGEVAAAIHDKLPYGNMVIIETLPEAIPEALRKTLAIPDGYSLYHLYAHFAEAPLVQLGEEIICGAPLGYVGQSGYNIPVAHLHIETRIGPSGVRFESMMFYDTHATSNEQKQYLRWRVSGEFQHFDPMLVWQGHPNE